MILSLVVVAVLAQDPITAEARFRSILERAEKAGLTVPDLAEAAAELQALSLTLDLPKDLRHRFEVVRAQARLLSSLHVLLAKRSGGLFDLVIGEKPSMSVKIVEVHRRGVKIFRGEGTQEVAFGELSPEWVLAAAGPAVSPLEAGLWLAKAARWESAFLAFGSSDTDHPLAVEARKRGVEGASSNLDSLIKGRRWTEALSRMDALDKLAPGDERLKSARGKLLDALVQHGQELCRKNTKAAMQDVIDLITKHFPDGASRIEDIREADRWIRVVEPRKFQIEARLPSPWLVEPKGDKQVFNGWLQEPGYEGVAAVVRFPKGVKTRGGLVWDDGVKIVSINAEDASVNVYSGNKGERLPNVFHRKINLEARHRLSVRLRGGSHVVQYNGEEIYRTEGTAAGFEAIALTAREGKAWFDEVQLLKKE